MLCANCGGRINYEKTCEDCGIEYGEMIANIQHSELRKLFKKIDELQYCHKNTDLEESLMACELANSSFIVPASVDVENNSFKHLEIKGPKNRKYITLCTDAEEFEHFEGYDAVTIPWRALLGWLDDGVEGFVINLFSEAAFITRAYLDDFFPKGDEESGGDS